MTSIGSPVPLLLSKSKPYEIERSLRFNSGDSTYLTRTPGSDGNRKTWTFSCWIKRSKVGALQTFFSAGSVNPDTIIKFDANDRFEIARFNNSEGGYVDQVTSSAKFRDTSSWYHVVGAVDTTQDTNTNRIKMYINGVQITEFENSNWPTEDYQYEINDASYAHYIGRHPDGQYSSCYITEFHFVDGQQLPASDFGETNAKTGQWIPKKFSGSYGTNGFYLNFSDNSNTTSGTLGKDSSGNSNDYTPNNFSVAAGIGNDSLTDTPNNNYPTFVTGTLDPNSEQGNGTGVSNGNLHQGLGDYIQRRSTIQFGPNGINSGKYYWEATLTGGDRATFCGITSNMVEGGGEVHSGADKSWVADENYKTYSATSSTTNTLTYASGVIYSFALDMDTSPPTLKAYRGNSLVYTDTSLPTDKNFTPFLFSTNSGSGVTFCNTDINFGQRAFTYTPPTGHKDCGTKNLPDPAVAIPTDHFNTILYTGNDGTDRVISGVGFSPDLVWLKNRDDTGRPCLFDTQRLANGEATMKLSSDVNSGQEDKVDRFKGMESDGFTVTGSDLDTNENNDKYVAWNWLANTSAVTNDSGSNDTSVRANSTAGFSIVTWSSGSTAVLTLGHGLSAAPQLIITKRTDSTGSWNTYHSGLGGANKKLDLDTDAGTETNATIWGNTAPTNSVFSMNCFSGETLVAYCFTRVPGYTRIDSYSGNNSSNGPFIWCGFRPAYVLIKSTSSGENWFVYDDARSPYNNVGLRVAVDLNGTDSSSTFLDFYSNGFKAVNTSGSYNSSGSTFVYIAIAAQPYKTANAH